MSVFRSPPRAWRWLLILAASIIAHLLVMGWAGGYLVFPRGTQDKADDPLTVALLPPPVPRAAPPVSAKPPPPRATPERKPERKPATTPKPAPSTPPAVVTESPSTIAAPDVPAGPTAAPAASSAPAAPVEAAPAQAAESLPWSADPPPAAELDYAVTAQRDGGSWHGAGRFLWQTDGDRYRISGEASVTILFRITVLNFRSEGRINPGGIMPERYSETPWRKDTALTWFDRDAGRISFSSSTATWPLEGGEQDRASIAWQLAALGRGDASRFSAGEELEIVVAGARGADRWRFRIIGMEEVETPHGRHLAWHVQRAPRGGRRDQGIDIWLAPTLEWYPVRVRHNYANGEFLDMSLSELRGGTPSAEK